MSAARPSVLHFIDTTGPGGAETVFLQLAAGLRDRGWPARTVVVGPGWVLDRIRQLELPVDVIRTRGSLDVAYLQRLSDIVRERRIALIQSHLYSPAVYASAVGLWTRTPVVATFHGASDVMTRGLGAWLRYGLIARRTRVVCVSESLRAALAATRRFRVDRLHLICNGVDVARFGRGDGTALRSAHGIASNTVLVGALGNVRPAKDYATLLRAAAVLSGDPRFQFAIVGERTQPLYGELLRLRESLGLTDRVHFWGFREDVAEVVSAFDMLAISSRTEGFSLAAIQAMAAGKPVVATRCGGPEGIITDGVDGMLVPVGSPDALASALRTLADTPGDAARIAGSARRTVRDRFSLAAMLDRYEELYDELTAGGRSQPSTTSGTSVASSSS